MTKKVLVLVALTLLVNLALVGNFVFAQEPEIGTAEDNACHPGGLMWRPDGNGCMSDWHWSCGWHLARWVLAGEWFGKYPFPLNCASVLPPPPEPPAIVASDGGCFLVNDAFVADIPAGTLTVAGNVLANDCAPQLNLNFFGSGAGNNISLVSLFSNGDAGARCITAGNPYGVTSGYTDQTGRTASFGISGNCQ